MAYSNKTGLPAPSDILRPWVDPTYFTEESRERGTCIHDAIAAHFRDEFFLVPRQWRGYFDSFLSWADRERPEPVIVEQRLTCPTYGFSGQPDLVGKIKSRPGIGVVDFKTGLALGDAWPLQVAAYRHLADVTLPTRTSWGCSVRLRSDGSYPLVKYYQRFEVDFNLFLSALNLHRHFGQW